MWILNSSGDVRMHIMGAINWCRQCRLYTANGKIFHRFHNYLFSYSDSILFRLNTKNGIFPPLFFSLLSFLLVKSRLFWKECGKPNYWTECYVPPKKVSASLNFKINKNDCDFIFKCIFFPQMRKYSNYFLCYFIIFKTLMASHPTIYRKYLLWRSFYACSLSLRLLSALIIYQPMYVFQSSAQFSVKSKNGKQWW